MLTQSQLSAINGGITLNSPTYSLNTHPTLSTLDWANSGISNPLVKRYEVIESTEDIVVLAVTANRVFKESQLHYKLLDSELFRKVSSDDRVKAQAIKDYYSKRIMMNKLKGQGTMSSFREDLNKLIHSDCLTFRENMIGVAYWLPEFHEYDTTMDNVKSNIKTNQDFDGLNKKGTPGTLRLTATLEPIKCVRRFSKRTKVHEYWFKDTKLDAGVVISLEDKNQLKPVWDYIFSNENQMSIK